MHRQNRYPDIPNSKDISAAASLDIWCIQVNLEQQYQLHITTYSRLRCKVCISEWLWVCVCGCFTFTSTTATLEPVCIHGLPTIRLPTYNFNALSRRSPSLPPLNPTQAAHSLLTGSCSVYCTVGTSVVWGSISCVLSALMTLYC